MSATLGIGGELERLIGMTLIARLPVPAGWDKGGTGRRLFLFPGLTSEADTLESPEFSAMSVVDRSLVLVPSNGEVEKFAERAYREGLTVVRAAQVEEDMRIFTEGSKKVLVLANRYDGIDLPNDACRMLVMRELPAGIGMLEQFLYQRLLVRSVFRDRIRTRFSQGVGRCTRGVTDYAVVVIEGQGVLDFCARLNERATLHPELQAEIEFGVENSKDLTWADLTTLASLFLERDDYRAEVESEVTSLRSGQQLAGDDVSGTLRKIVGDELAYGWQCGVVIMTTLIRKHHESSINSNQTNSAATMRGGLIWEDFRPHS